ncbi:glucan endo-1 [Quercus suber]|uniref:glucan endo-1,3-beta-D-glucosidase n=1 Tax=Quercus suber TaxID=58331 RepID=A0AAW0KF58_QUESU
MDKSYSTGNGPSAMSLMLTFVMRMASLDIIVLARYRPYMITLFGPMLLFNRSCRIGVCYGMLGNNLPSPREVINMYKQYNIGRIQLYGQNYGAFLALRGTNIELMLGVPNEEL